MSQYSFSYNYDSLNDAFNAVNRKGKMQKRYLSPEYLASAQEYRDMRKELNEILRKKTAERTEDEADLVEFLKQSMKKNAQQQKALLQEHLIKVSSNILSSSFRFNLTPDSSADPKKPVYSIGTTAEEFFAMQVLCWNVKKLFNISMSSRNEILSQLKILLREDKSRYYIIRTDVCHCFESIPHDKLFEYLEGNNLLDVKSKSLLRGLIRKEFEAKNLRPLVQTPQTGIPRGCAISSLLSEFYLSKIDEVIKRSLPGVLFLGRYVDDIVLVIHPDIRDEFHKSIDWYIEELKEIYYQKGLTIHTPSDGSGKCYKYDSAKAVDLDFNLLGYNVHIDNKNRDRLVFSLSQDKLEKITKRIDKTFTTFDNMIDVVGFDVAAHYLFDALHVLTCNINLYNAKKGVKVGIFYSNQLLDNKRNLSYLDGQLSRNIGRLNLSSKASITIADRAIIEDRLKRKLALLSFAKGFDYPHKRYKVKKQRLRTIKSSWV
ncbi:RNA-directed DNA polymerase [Prevotella sp. oral taxon 306 str. F0472]|uniref:antiviral reverse transcriptase Drt3a n=1 Tax=Prevotella sp. oral taxon 306 TaxID=712461 RepID=UPI00025BA1D3|nr:antiviral reverse transcriptase Drt3a [Prevotella sp. oral taxon 306]EID32682.1 RNA-directed DNA polymerase [Prevotella sp. oral taxon 306 str. F0472]